MSESKSWIIVSDEGPSTHPVRHTSFEEAKTESFRLAKLRPDLKFGVFELVGTAVDLSVAFEVPDANPAVEYRLYNGIPTWGFSRGETFFPFNSKEGAEHGTKYPSENYTGRPVSACPLVPEPGYAYYSF
jgi:hypothetical protein